MPPTPDPIAAIERALEGDMSQPLTAVDRLRMMVGGVTTHTFDMHDADWVLDALETLLSLARNASSAEARAEKSEALAERLKLEAQAHATEARTANSTIAAIYQSVSGATGEPGNWHGAAPVREKLEAMEREIAEKNNRILSLTRTLMPFARIADMEKRAESCSSVMVNVDRCRDARTLLNGGSDAQG